jgi:hypothetical protein
MLGRNTLHPLICTPRCYRQHYDFHEENIPIYSTMANSPKPVPLTKVSWSNIAVGAAVSLFEVTTLGQPLEVMKTHMAANRSDGLVTSLRKTWARGGVLGFYQGLIPWVRSSLWVRGRAPNLGQTGMD